MYANAGRRTGVLLVLTLAVAAALGALGTTALIEAVRPPAPIAYDQPVYVADDAALCPGDPLIWTPTLTLRDGGLVTVTRTFWDVTRNRAAQTRDGATLPSIEVARVLPPSLAGRPRANAVRLAVPDLAPGAYLVATSAHGVGTDQAVYVVYFATQEC